MSIILCVKKIKKMSTVSQSQYTDKWLTDVNCFLENIEDGYIRLGC